MALSALHPAAPRARTRKQLQRCRAALDAKPSGELPWTAEQQAALRRGAGIPLAAYDPAVLASEFASQPGPVAARVATITASLGAVAAAVAFDWATGAVSDPARQRQRGAQLRRALTRLGPTFIKLGQALSTRPDLLPAPYLDELVDLQDALPGFPDAEAFALVESELGRPLEAVFSRISPRPIAAASLGQVYKATLLDGTPVALKVQRPGAAARLKIDFFVVRSGAVLLDAAVASLHTSLAAGADAFIAKVYGELDYTAEGRAAERFEALYGDAPDVIVPSIFWQATSPRVLTLSWIDGVKLSDTAGLRARGLDVIKLVNVGIKCSLRQLLEYGYFHADPHPGNLLGTADNKLAFLDFGMMSETPQPARHAIVAHVVHLVNRDYDEMARDYYRLGFLERSVDVRPIVPALAAFFDNVLDATVSQLNFQTLTKGLGAILYAYPFNVPAYYALILRSLTVLEGLALSTDPEFKVLAAAYPFFAARLLADDAPALREALTELLIKGGRVRWARLEELLREANNGGLRNSTLSAAALPALLDLLLGAEGPVPDAGAAQLRQLAEGEAARVTEALLLGGGWEALPNPLRQVAAALPPQLWALGSPAALLDLEPSEAAEVTALRNQVLRIAALLQSDAQAPAVDWQALLSQPRVAAFVNAVATRVGQRAMARAVRVVLGTPTPPLTPALAR